VLAVKLLCGRRDPLLGELANGGADELVLWREVEVHAWSPFSQVDFPGCENQASQGRRERS
jgi:hypothetical protein